MNHHSYIPSSPLVQGFVQSFWQVHHTTTFRQEYIIPKGIVEIIFNFSDELLPVKTGNGSFSQARCFVNGYNTAPVISNLPRRQFFFGVQLQPLAAKKILGVPAGKFADIPVDLELIDPAFGSLWHQIAAQDSFNQKIETFCKWIGKKFCDLQPQEKGLNDFLCAAGGYDLTVKELAGSLCYSPRHLSRKIIEATGLNTEEILMYKKYLRAVHLMHHSELSLTQIAYQCNFSDQSHFIRSFKALAQLTPGEYYRARGMVKGHVYKDVR